MSTIIGSFSDQGQPLAGTKSQAQKDGTGHYNVTFHTAFNSLPAIVVTPQTDGLGTGYVVASSIQNVTKNGFTVYFTNLSNPPGNENASFSFMAAPNN